MLGTLDSQLRNIVQRGGGRKQFYIFVQNMLSVPKGSAKIEGLPRFSFLLLKSVSTVLLTSNKQFHNLPLKKKEPI